MKREVHLLTLLFGVSFILAVHGYCCNKKAPNIASHIAICADCEIKEWCCAGGACNIFCCNCEGGCRQGTCWARGGGKKRRSLDYNVTMEGERSGHSIVYEGDQNRDGRLSIDEAHEYLMRLGVAQHPHKYRGVRDLHLLDVDQDHFISAQEIDEDV